MTVTTIDVGSWQNFQEVLGQIRATKFSRPSRSGEFIVASPDKFLYRGQPDSQWRLETTLDRYLSEGISVKEYYRYAFRVKHRLETYTGNRWSIPEPPAYEAWLEKQDGALFFENHAVYEYFAFLRHHGFPSPFLDWTASPYIAAFFAMHDVGRDATHASIYVYIEDIGIGKVSTSGEPTILTHGPYGNIHERHFLQQSQYTACVTHVQDEGLCYVPHEDAMAEEPATPQDLFWKLNIPLDHQREFLTELDSMNVNAFSLFGGLDSLVSALALKEMWLKHARR